MIGCCSSGARADVYVQTEDAFVSGEVVSKLNQELASLTQQLKDAQDAYEKVCFRYYVSLLARIVRQSLYQLVAQTSAQAIAAATELAEANEARRASAVRTARRVVSTYFSFQLSRCVKSVDVRRS